MKQPCCFSEESGCSPFPLPLLVQDCCFGPWGCCGTVGFEVIPSHNVSQLIGKDLDADWMGKIEKGATEDEMVGWHH